MMKRSGELLFYIALWVFAALVTGSAMVLMKGS